MSKKILYGNPALYYLDDDLHLSGNSIQDYVDEYSTPTFVISAERIRNNIKSIKKAFGEIGVYYSVKSNYLTQVIDCVVSEGTGLEVISEPELRLVERMKMDPKKILVGGPWIPTNMIERAFSMGVTKYVAYDIEDIKKFIDIGCLNNESILIIRILGASVESRYGIPPTEESLQDIYNLLQENNVSTKFGFLRHERNQAWRAEDYTKNVDIIISAANILKKIGGEVVLFDIGGGLPEASICQKQLKPFADAVKMAMDQANWEVELICEPGRFIVGDAAICIAECIRYMKESNTMVLNVGRQYIPKFGKNPLRFYKIKNEKTKQIKTEIRGPVPSDIDLLVKNYGITNPGLGEKIVITNVGSYALTFSNRFPYTLPNIIFEDNNIRTTAHTRNTPGDISLQ